MSDGGMAPQLTVTSGPFARSDASCSAATTSSLPVPLSPVTSTVQLATATCSMVLSTSRMLPCCPTIFPWLVMRRVDRTDSGRT